MSVLNDLRETLEHTETAQFVTTMLRDISATKLQAIRSAFEANEAYFSELHDLMTVVEEQATIAGMLPQPGQARRVLVGLTANKRFYGTLNRDVIAHLEKQLTAEADSDCVVIGQTGQQLMQHSQHRAKATYVQFERDEPQTRELLQIVEQLSVYDEVVVIHPTFINSFEQTAKLTDLTHRPSQADRLRKRSSLVEYIFEPDLIKMLRFFTTHIRLTLFQRVLLETQVALTGARLMKMQRARERAGELLKQQRLVIHKEMTTIQSMRLLETFSGFRAKDSL